MSYGGQLRAVVDATLDSADRPPHQADDQGHGNEYFEGIRRRDQHGEGGDEQQCAADRLAGPVGLVIDGGLHVCLA